MPKRAGRGWPLLAFVLLILVILWLTGNLREQTVILHSTPAQNQQLAVILAS
jgi:hypothetical protein